VQGALKLIADLGEWLISSRHALSRDEPEGGRARRMCGLLAIRSALEARGDKREVVLVPESAHGTNPATAPLRAIGWRTSRPPSAGGRPRSAEGAARAGRAGVMITNPNTCGLFEPDMIAISEAVHAAGGFVYCDGANFNAIVGRVRPGDLGIDAMHINLHKTFSTPHGGGDRAPAGGVLRGADSVCAAALRREEGERYELVEERRRASITARASGG
jgi:glycine dehydrogenase subunit 2